MLNYRVDSSPSTGGCSRRPRRIAVETEKSLLFAQRVKKVELGKARRDVKYKGSGTAVGAKRTASRGGRRA